MANPTPPSSTPTGNNLFQQTPTLSQIQIKVRRLTRTPSPALLSDADINNYINTFLTYDFPKHLRTFNLLRPFTFFTNAFQDTYNTDELSFAGAINNPLYNFQNLYISVNPPTYVAGFEAMYTQSREQFFNLYPMVNSISSIGQSGDGLTTNFTGVVNSQQAILPSSNFKQNIILLQNNILFSSIDISAQGIALADVPVVDSVTGNKLSIGNLYDPNSAAYQAALKTPPTVVLVNNNINYITGVFDITFTSAPGIAVPINSQTVPQVASLPQSILFYNNQFTVRPVPDQPYRVNFEVYQRPVALLATGQAPELEEYWQYIAYGAAKKIFEDRMDLESVQLITPEYENQRDLVHRRTIVQNTNQRSATIYQQQVNGNNWGYNSFGYGPF